MKILMGEGRMDREKERGVLFLFCFRKIKSKSAPSLLAVIYSERYNGEDTDGGREDGEGEREGCSVFVLFCFVFVRANRSWRFPYWL